MAAGLINSGRFFSSTLPAQAPPLTLFGMASVQDESSSQWVIGIISDDRQSYYSLQVNPLTTPKRASSIVSVRNGFGDFSAVVNTYPLNTWIARAGIESSSTSRRAWLGIAPGTESTKNVSPPDNLSEFYLGRHTDNAAPTLIAECAIWNVTLTDAEINSLAKGFKPSRIRPQSLVFYAPLVRAAIDVRKGITLTPVNGPTVADHPRVY